MAAIDLDRLDPAALRIGSLEWSALNVRKVGELRAAGRMRGPGLAEVEAALADGRWAAAQTSGR